MKPSTLPRVAMSVAVIGLLCACAASGVGEDASADADAADSDSPSATRPPFETAPASTSQPATDAPAGVPGEVWSAILADLYDRLGGAVEASAVELVSAEEATWNDGSLGCPQPGELYTQALVDGMRVVVELDGTEYDYRAPNLGTPRLCESSPPSGG